MENSGTLNLGFNFDQTTGGQSYDKPQSPQDGISYWRILPSLNSSLSLFHKYALHWGFTNAAGKTMPVQCSYLSEKFCPVCARVREVEGLFKRAEQNGDTAKMEEYQEFISKWQVKNQFLYNALNAAGEAVILSVGKKTHDQIIDKIKECVQPPRNPDGSLKRPAFDPTSLADGVWLQITRSGKGFKTEYKVDFNRISVDMGNGVVGEKIDRRPVDPAIAEAIRLQIANGGVGTLKDIHNLHEVRTSADLQGMMNGTQPVGKGTVGNAPAQALVAPPVYQTPVHAPSAPHPAAPVAPPVYPGSPGFTGAAGGAAPIPQAQTAIPPLGNTLPGTGAPTQPAGMNFDPAEARKRLEERLRASQTSNS